MNEFRKKKYDRQYQTNDDRHNALLEYLHADCVEELLAHAQECQEARRNEMHGNDSSIMSALPDASHSPSHSKASKNKEKGSKKSSSSKHRKGHSSISGDRFAMVPLALGNTLS